MLIPLKTTYMVSGFIDTADHQKSRFHNRISVQIRSHMQKGRAVGLN
jgi:hypothetical protein